MIGPVGPVVLASTSPRRLALLRAAGIEPTVVPPPAEAEAPWTGGSPAAHAVEQAAAKARAVLPRVPSGWVVGADTVVVLDEQVLGKPRDAGEAAAMLRRLSGRTHSVLTGVAVGEGGTGAVREAVERTVVTFSEMSEKEIAGYVATGEPLDKAGAYGIQGRGGVFVARIEGCYFNVVGLPVPLLYRMLRA